jgi:uncharacterized protein YjbI with pentapeptide repeats
MKKLTQEQIDKDIAAHGKWLRGEDGGTRIDWSGCNLQSLDMRGADMSEANMRGADMSEANMSGAAGVKNASCSWTEHGERGRQLLAVRIDGKDVYFCGCFKGSLDNLRDYIKRGDKKHAASRTIAADFVSARMAEMKDAK